MTTPKPTSSDYIDITAILPPERYAYKHNTEVKRLFTQEELQALNTYALKHWKE